MASTPKSFRELIDLWPSQKDFAAETGIIYVTARTMYRRNRIGPEYWPSILAAAKKRRFFTVRKELLADLAMESAA